MKSISDDNMYLLVAITFWVVVGAWLFRNGFVFVLGLWIGLAVGYQLGFNDNYVFGEYNRD